jgi:hypothetical protein
MQIPNQNFVIAFVALGAFALFAPQQYIDMIPVKLDTQMRQIIGALALVAAYYYYNGEKLM